LAHLKIRNNVRFGFHTYNKIQGEDMNIVLLANVYSEVTSFGTV
jgi:hypothetical protein